MVVEIGAGTGLNAAFLPTGARWVVVEPNVHFHGRIREAAQAHGLTVDLRDGAAESLPVADGEADAVVSTLVLCSVDDVSRSLAEARRVLRPGGRLAISDVVLTAALPDEVRADLSNHSACVSGAATVDELDGLLRAAGFVDIAIEPVSASREFIRDWIPGRDASEFAASASITARRPQA